MSRKVLHVIPAVAPRYGGPSAVIVGTCAALRLAGVETLMVTTDADGNGRLNVVTGRAVVFEGVPAIFFRRDFSEAFKWSFSLAGWLRQHCGGFDLVDIHAIFSHSSIRAGSACRRAGVPYIVRPHGALNPWGLGRKRWQKRILFRLAVKRLLAGAAAILYTSAREMELAQTAFPWLPPGAVVAPGVEGPAAGDSEPAGATDRPYVLALSRLAASKRLDQLILAFHRVAIGEPMQNWRLIIAGDGDTADVAELKRLASRGPAGERIKFRGWVTGHDKRTLLAGASLIAAPSHQESFGLSLVEAMTYGVPVLTSGDVDLAREIQMARAGWVVGSGTAALDEALGCALASRAELEQRGHAARCFARTFQWPAASARLLALYGQVWGEVATPTFDRCVRV